MNDWQKLDIKVTNYIYVAISNKRLEYVGDLKTAYIIKKFDEMYLRESTLLIVWRNNLENIKFKNYQKLKVFFLDFEKAINELECAGAIGQEKLNYVIKLCRKITLY